MNLSQSPYPVDGQNNIRNFAYIAVIFLLLDAIIVLGLALVPFQIMLIAGISVLIMMIILKSPLGIVYFLILSFPVIMATYYFSEKVNILRFVFTASLIMVFIGNVWLRGKKIEMFPLKLMTPFILFLLYVTCTMLLSSNPAETFELFFHLVYYLGVAITIFNCVKSDNDWRNVTYLIMTVTSILSVSVLMTYGIGITRVSLYGVNPNSFALMITAGYGFALYSFFTENRLTGKLPGLITMILSSLTLLASGSRGGWLTFVILNVIFLWISGRKRILFLASICGLIAFAIIYADNQALFQMAQKTRLFSGLTGRPELWKGGIGIIKDHFLIGVGMGGVGEHLRYYMDMTSPVIPLFVHIPVLGGKLHNGYLQTLAETGIIGTSILIWANVMLVIYFMGKIKEHGDQIVKTIAILGLSMVVSHLVRSIFESSFLFGFISRDWIMLISLAIIIRVLELKSRKHMSPAVWKTHHRKADSM